MKNDWDKSNGDVKFRESDHKYFNVNNPNENYISVTTLIGKYGQEFDKNFWSGYKALQKILKPEEFRAIKKGLLSSHRINLKELMDYFHFTELEYNLKQQDILDEWQKKNEEACELGTKVHAELEHNYTKKKTTDLKKYHLGGVFTVNTNASLEKAKRDLLSVDKGIFPEYLIYSKSNDGILCLAGQIDLLIKDGKDIFLVDYKGLPLDTVIPTKDGWSTMSEIKVGDKIFDKDGNLTTVTHKSTIHHNPCYRIYFDNNTSIVADKDHRWLIHLKEDKVMTTKEIYDYMQTHVRQVGQIPRIINSKPLNLPDKELPIDPYVLGAWLGDGSKGSGNITQGLNSKLWEIIKSRGYELGENYVHNRNSVEGRNVRGLCTKLRELGILFDKKIPDIYHRASIKQRIDLLRGLMDTDGYYNKTRRRFVMSTGQEWQKDDMVKLLSGLGIKATVFKTIRKLNGKRFQAWDVCFTEVRFNPFLMRNQDIDLNSISKKDSHSFRNIKKIDPVDMVPTQCITVDSPSHTYLCTEECIVTHNTNGHLDQHSAFDPNKKKPQMMKYPLNTFEDCNMSHYQLQLSTYAWMVQKLDPSLNIAGLTIEHHAHDGSVTSYPLDYCKKAVERMLKDYKKQLILQIKKDKRKRIDF